MMTSVHKKHYGFPCLFQTFLFGLLLFSSTFSLQAGGLKPRLVVLTDIGPNDIEPDDRESLIRLFSSADLFEIEALCAGTGWNTGNYPPGWKDSIMVTIDAYEKDLPNLMKRSDQKDFLPDESKQTFGYWPSADYLRSRTMLGSSKMGYSVLGNNNNSAGSDQIIKLADEADERPLHIAVWGGGNTVAQAIWRVQQERTTDELKTFLHKLRIYTITDQDKPWTASGTVPNYSSSSHQWMRREFEKDLLFIWDECAWLHQNSTGVNRWAEYSSNIQGHGNLGAMYPKYRWGVEGDTPSYMYLMAPGLSDPDEPMHGSWGGYAQWMKTQDGSTYAYVNYNGTPAYDTCYKYVNYFYRANFNNFAARMDWAKDGSGNRNPILVVNNDSTCSVLTVKPLQGTSMIIDAAGSYDPDGNTLSFKWWFMPCAGTWKQPITIADASSARTSVSVPSGSAGMNFHLVCEVTDNGSPALTSYRRIIFEPTDQMTGVSNITNQKMQLQKNNHSTAVFDITGRRVSLAGGHIGVTSRVVLRKDELNRTQPLVIIGKNK